MKGDGRLITVFLFVYLLGGAWQDLKEGKISNWWHAFFAICFITAVFIRGPSEGGLPQAEYLLFLFRIVLFTVIFFPLFLFRMMGAGDVKTMALIGGYLGISDGFSVILSGLAVSAVWSFLYMIQKKILIKRIAYFAAYMKRAFTSGELTAYYRIGKDSSYISFCLVPFFLCGFLLWEGWQGGVL